MPTIAERASGDPDLPLIQIDNTDLRLVFAPSVGGRLLSIMADGQERLWRDLAILDDRLRVRRPRATWARIDGTFASWTNLGGGKTWPAPQGWGGAGEWAGPPDAVLDAGPWGVQTATTADEAIIELTSAEDAVTGLRVQRKFVVPATGRRFSETVRFTNITTTEISWAAWEVVQVPVALGDVVEIESSSSVMIDLGTYRGSPAWSYDGARFQLPVAAVVAKRGFPAAGGRVLVPGRLEISTATVDGGHYPDRGSRAEVWLQAPLDSPIEELSGLHPDAWLVELELLSPTTRLAPGESFDFVIDWFVPQP